MSLTIPKTITKDWRSVEQEDATANRRIAIKNIQRETREMAPQWKTAQMKLYGNTLDITPDTSSLGQVISTEGLSLQDTDNNETIALQEITKIANRTIAEYVVDRLEPAEVAFLVVNFKGILRDLKKRKSRLDKDAFITIVKQMSGDNPMDMESIPADLSSIGEANQMRRAERGRELSDRFQQREDDYADEVARRNIEADEKTREAFERRADARSKEQIRETNEQDREQKRRYNADPDNNPLETGSSNDLFENAELAVRQSVLREKMKSKARQRQQDREDARLMNENTSAPTTAGVGSVDYANPTLTPTISPLQDRILYGANPPTPQQLFQSLASPTPQEFFQDLLDQPSPAVARRSGRSRNPKPTYDPQTGKGVMYGRGYKLTETSKKNRHYIAGSNGKFYIELHKLKENVLSVKYSSTDAHLTTVKVQMISDDVKTLIEDVLKEKYNERLFQQLNPNDKRVFKRFVKGVKLDIPINDDLEKQFQKDYQVLKGQFESGNDSPEIKNALKRFVLEGLAENRINKNEAHFLLYQLSL